MGLQLSLHAQAESLTFCVHAAVTAFFLDSKRGQIGDNQQRNHSHPSDDDHCKGVEHNLTEVFGSIGWAKSYPDGAIALPTCSTLALRR